MTSNTPSNPPSSRPMTLRQQLIEILAKVHMDGARYSQEYIKAANKIARDGKPPISFYEPVTRILNNSADDFEALCQEIAREARYTIATPCPACKHKSLIISADNWLVCGNLECSDPAAINGLAELTQKPPQEEAE